MDTAQPVFVHARKSHKCNSELRMALHGRRIGRHREKSETHKSETQLAGAKVGGSGQL